MGAEYRAFYKCRLCGETFPSGATTGREIACLHMVELAAIGHPTILNAPLMLTTHYCDGEGMGLADFIGWKPKQSK